MLNSKIIISIVFVFGSLFCFSQNLVWKGGSSYFFDNTEYERSSLTDDQTINGVSLTPELGMEWDQNHAIFGGVNVVKRSGSSDFTDNVSLVAYYQFKSKNHTLYAGAFPRNELLDNYSDFFIQDSVRFIRPIMQGAFWQYENKTGFINLWIDWTSFQSATEREAFYLGASGFKRWGMFFIDFQSYLFHYANTRPSTPNFHVTEQSLTQLSAGFDVSEKVPLDKLSISAGLLTGLERERNTEKASYTPTGGVLKLDVGYKFLTVKNLFYAGDKRMRMYEEFGSNFYWNTPFLRSNYYLQSRWQFRLIKNRFVNAKIAVNMHYSESKIHWEQMLLITANIVGRPPKTLKGF